MPDPQSHLKAAELAQRWRVTTGHLANLRYQGAGPDFIRLGKAVRYPLEAIESYEADHYVSAVSA